MTRPDSPHHRTPDAGGSEDLRPLWRRYRATRDPSLRDLLIRRTIGLVRRVAGRLALRLPPHVALDDLESAGVPGLLAAVESFDPDKEVEFAAYAQVRIRGAILDELRSLDPLPRSLREKARQIERVTTALEQRLLRAPADDEVAEAMELPLEEYHQILYDLRGGLTLSTDGAWSGAEDEEESGAPPVVDHRALDPWQAMAAKDRRALLGAVIDALPDGERTVLSLYYYEELTMREIGAVLEVSESRVSQIHSAALLRIRSRLQRRRMRADDLRIEEPRSAGGLAHALL
jgi:RNA polymerase sigma factor FliA